MFYDDWFSGTATADDDTYTAEDYADQESFVEAQAESGQGQLQGDLGEAFRNSASGDWNMAEGHRIMEETRAQFPENIDTGTRQILSSNGGSLGDVLRAAREGLTTSQEAVRLGLDYNRLIADPYTVGSGANQATVIPPRVNGDNRPGTLSSSFGLPWGTSATVDKLKAGDPVTVLTVAGGGLLAGWLLKRALAAL